MMKFGHGLTHDLPAARDSECPHDRSDDDVGPAAAGSKYPCRSGDYGKIADGIVAGANPDRAHVGVPAAEAKQHGGDTHVCQEEPHPGRGPHSQGNWRHRPGSRAHRPAVSRTAARRSISARNIAPFSASAIHKARRHEGLLSAGPSEQQESWWWWQSIFSSTLPAKPCIL